MVRQHGIVCPKPSFAEMMAGCRVDAPQTVPAGFRLAP